ncbi:MAG: hypothetical protein LBD11_02715 [Candidatus Peribacteria bacterium]|jgi:hypothetical protein|nr:hypothetical protein [Candidatus Peribacteria bacterium]
MATIRIKVTASPKPDDWSKLINSFDIEEGISMEEFFDKQSRITDSKNRTPHPRDGKYSTIRYNSQNISPSDMKKFVLKEGDNIFLADDASGNENK